MNYKHSYSYTHTVGREASHPFLTDGYTKEKVKKKRKGTRESGRYTDI